MSDMVKRLRSHIVGADPASRCDAALRDAADEIERLRQLIEDIDASGIHSCHDRCQRLECVQRREIERLRQQLGMPLDTERENERLRAEVSELRVQLAVIDRAEASLQWAEADAALFADYDALLARCEAVEARLAEAHDLLAHVDELREAAGKVTCERCGGSTCAPEHGRGIPAPGTCPDCADLRRLLEEKP